MATTLTTLTGLVVSLPTHASTVHTQFKYAMLTMPIWMPRHFSLKRFSLKIYGMPPEKIAQQICSIVLVMLLNCVQVHACLEIFSRDLHYP